MPKISAYTAITDVESNDLLVVVDVNDTTMAPAGTTKKMTVGQLIGPVTFTFGSSGGAPSAGTYTAGAIATDQNGVLRVCTVSGSPGTWARVGQAPDQFYVDDYGALGNGKVFTAGSGSSGSSAFHDTTNDPFVSGDTGKVIIANQGTGGSNTNPFTGTITYVSSSQVTLSANLGAAASAAPYIYGTDDTAAINNCLTAAAAYAEANQNKARVVFSARFYMLAALTQTTSPRQNCHIPLPFASATASKLYIDLVGTGFSPESQYWETEVPQLGGTVLVSAFTPPNQPDATYGQFAMVSVPNNGSGQAGSFCNAMYNLSGITLCMPWNAQTIGMDGLYLAQMGIQNGRCAAFAPVNFSGAAVGGPWLYNGSEYTTNDLATGFRFPTWGNNAFNFADYLSVEGISIGVDVAEHTSMQFLKVLYADRPIQISNTSISPVSHGITIQQASVEQSNHVVYVNNGDAGANVPIWIGLLDMESQTTDHVNDPNSNLIGFIGYNSETAGHPVVSGGLNVRVIDMSKNLPGPWGGAPAAPGSGAAQQNLAYLYATIYASSTGSISAVSVGQGTASMTSLGLTAGPGAIAAIRVNPGAWYALTYSGTASTTWVLD